jgi:type IV pilus assembly protein PilO
MNFDLSQFENLELDNVANWPPAAKFMLCVFFAIVVFALGYFVMVKDQLAKLDNAQIEEVTLKEQYKTKYHVSANLDLFKQQMNDAEALFANQLKSLPESHETPGLLDDITFVGTTSGLDFVRLEWQPEISKEIYIELPIDIEVLGIYHDFGSFVSKIAGLPRIVTVHDFTIAVDKQNSSKLQLKLQAKTYRYREAAKS